MQAEVLDGWRESAKQSVTRAIGRNCRRIKSYEDRVDVPILWYGHAPRAMHETVAPLQIAGGRLTTYRLCPGREDAENEDEIAQ